MAIPNRDIFLAKTLLYHGTDLPIDAGKNKVRRDEAAFYGVYMAGGYLVSKKVCTQRQTRSLFCIAEQ